MATNHNIELLNRGQHAPVVAAVLIDPATGQPYIATGGGGGDNTDYEIRQIEYVASAAGTGYSVDDRIVRADIFNVTATPASLVSTL